MKKFFLRHKVASCTLNAVGMSLKLSPYEDILYNFQSRILRYIGMRCTEAMSHLTLDTLNRS